MHGKAIAVLFTLAVVSGTMASTSKGLKVSGTSILDSHGHPFVMRGINYPHSWFKQDAEKAIPAIAATGANVVRIVLSDGSQYNYDDASQLQRLIKLCKNSKIVAVLEVHDATGKDDVQALQRATDYWISMAKVLRGLEDRVIINIANEWLGSSGKGETWAAGYRTVIPRLRSAGLKHLLMVDSAGWGQDAGVIAEQGRSVFESDPDRNVVFSIHMYEVAGKNANVVKKHIDSSLAIGVPVIIGEFSDKQNGHSVDYRSILEYTQKRSVGCLAWSWYGNSADTANMDLATSPAGSLTSLGKRIILGRNGIAIGSKAPAVIW